MSDGFDLLGPLPEGTTVLEASAGTGKTYAIVGLATRYVAEGVADMSELLLVTFSRAATHELRERTRKRFTSAASGLADPAAARASDDELLRHLGTGTAEEVAQRRQRLVRAISEFDSGTIATTHSFCQRMLEGLGIAGEREPQATFVEVVDDLVAEVVSDLYLRRYGAHTDATPEAWSGEPAITPADARNVARAAVEDRWAELSPTPDAETEAGHRVSFAADVRAEVERRKRLIGLRDFDDLLGLLHGVLTDPAHGEAACGRIRQLYRVVLVDEFQDTDPLQWDILRRAFHGTTTLVLVGDPKQAIYAFRGAEVLSYLDAVQLADTRSELLQNRRSDAPLLTALDHVYGGAALGHDRIVVPTVEPTRFGSRISGAPPLRLRYLPRTGCGPVFKSGFPAISALRARVADDLAADIQSLLGGDTELALDSSPRPVEPGDIAVLVRTRAQIGIVRAALDRAGVPSVLAGGSSVFGTAAATHWLRVLQALEQPHRNDRVRLAALSPLIGWTAQRLDERGEDGVAEVGSWLRELATVFTRNGFAAVSERIAAETGVAARLLAVTGGERDLTDLRHVAQLLERVSVEESAGITALTRWLTERVKDPGADTAADRSRRLDSDAAAVQIATVHASKGLEFPIVYVPYAWDAARNPEPGTLLLHDDDGRRILDVGGSTGPGYHERRRRHEAEEAGEELRLFYVALTRAMCQVVLWWAPSTTTAGSPLHRTIMGRPPGSPGIPGVSKVPPDPVVATALASWAAAIPDEVSVEPAAATVVAPLPRLVRGGGSDGLAVARFDRVLDDDWRRTSYSALTASAHGAPGVRSEAEDPGTTDEPDEPPLDDAIVTGALSAGASGRASALSLMNDLPYGAEFGTMVHEILEQVDTAALDLAGEVALRCEEAVAARLADVEPAALAAALLPVLHTPIATGGTLADIAPADRLPELAFELPLAGGDVPSGAATIVQIAELLAAHLPPDDPLAGYAEILATVEAPPLRGYLTGSIDAVLRTPGPRFVVVDYKTNRLGDGPLTVAHYSADRMAAEMIRAHYPLQALLYSVALHRFLRWRLPGYVPEQHLGGARYLFVRGMVGRDTPAGHGVFDWRPPAALVVATAELLA